MHDPVPSPVRGEQHDHGLLFANRTRIGIKSQRSADLVSSLSFPAADTEYSVVDG